VRYVNQFEVVDVFSDCFTGHFKSSYPALQARALGLLNNRTVEDLTNCALLLEIVLKDSDHDQEAINATTEVMLLSDSLASYSLSKFELIKDLNYWECFAVYCLWKLIESHYWVTPKEFIKGSIDRIDSLKNRIQSDLTDDQEEYQKVIFEASAIPLVQATEAITFGETVKTHVNIIASQVNRSISRKAQSASLKRHAKHYKLENEVITWYSKNKSQYKSMSKASEVCWSRGIAGTEICQRTVYDWIRKYKASIDAPS
jgi:hypothetical protein